MQRINGPIFGLFIVCSFEQNTITNILDSFDDNLVDVNMNDNMIEQELSRSYDEEETKDEETLDDLDLNENDLFNLIDSMYEKRDDEE